MHRITRTFSIMTALALAACSDSTGTASNNVRLSFSTTASPAASARLSANGSGIVTSLSGSAGGHTLVITRAQLVVSEMELKGAESSECSAGTSAEDGCHELELSPRLVELPVSPGATASIVTELPPGTYTGMEMKVDAIWPGEDDGAAFLAAHPGFEAVTVRLEGTWDGEPFVFISNGEAELHLTCPRGCIGSEWPGCPAGQCSSLSTGSGRGVRK